MNTKQVFKLSIEACLENLPDVRKLIISAGECLGVKKGAVDDLCVAADEAVTNVILHGYEGRAGTIELFMEEDRGAAVIRIIDRAKCFDASEISAPQLTTPFRERPPGGMGIYLIRKMTDETEFRSLPGGGNELRLVKWGVIKHNT